MDKTGVLSGTSQVKAFALGAKKNPAPVQAEYRGDRPGQNTSALEL